MGGAEDLVEDSAHLQGGHAQRVLGAHGAAPGQALTVRQTWNPAGHERQGSEERRHRPEGSGLKTLHLVSLAT